MKVVFATCLLLCCSACALSPATAKRSSHRPVPSAKVVPASSVQASYDRMLSDLRRIWWDDKATIPHVRPTRGGNSSETALDVGLIDNKALQPSFWQMTQYADVQYWEWKLARTPAAKARAKADIASQWQYIRRCFSNEALSAAAKSSGIINVSDDAAWEMNYLTQVHEVTGDSRALALATGLLPNILDRFADPNTARVSYGSLSGSPYGMLYATVSDDPDHQGRSTTYEIMAAAAALYIYNQNHNPDFLNYAIGTYNWTRKYMKHREHGYYYCELDIRPTVDGKPNDHYLKPVGDFYGPPVRGLSASYSGGTMAMALVAARLYKITGKEDYREEARKITEDYVRPDSFLRSGNTFVNERDAWTDGYWAPYFASEVLALPGIDPDGLWKTAIKNTALSIAAQRTPQGYYSADWSGPELNTSDGTTTWAQQGAKGTGSGRGMALPGQIMTTANSAAMIAAAQVMNLRAMRK